MFILCCSAFFCLVNACFRCVRFSFFSIPNLEIGLGERPWNDLFCVKWDVKPQLSQSIRCIGGFRLLVMTTVSMARSKMMMIRTSSHTSCLQSVHLLGLCLITASHYLAGVWNVYASTCPVDGAEGIMSLGCLSLCACASVFVFHSVPVHKHRILWLDAVDFLFCITLNYPITFFNEEK